ncbi:hypothetical protein OTJ99_001163 [Caldicellulosiruptor naganoensis]|uniref:Uncharacterized protein n=1 Tax=Caldicellulosiruptor naganoensis TaxID=29324 RepID=A0ABY7BJL5_9FIRM|nr:hypothetical protein OTJ99_001163 [Caldicellulosiruptor naganoensis]
MDFRDKLTLKVEVEDEFYTTSMKELIFHEFKNKIGVSAEIILCRMCRIGNFHEVRRNETHI